MLSAQQSFSSDGGLHVAWAHKNPPEFGITSQPPPTMRQKPLIVSSSTFKTTPQANSTPINAPTAQALGETHRRELQSMDVIAPGEPPTARQKPLIVSSSMFKPTHPIHPTTTQALSGTLRSRCTHAFDPIGMTALGEAPTTRPNPLIVSSSMFQATPQTYSIAGNVTGGTHHRTFKPMDMIVHGESQRNHAYDAQEKLARGFSHKYKGTLSNHRNQSADIPIDCSTHLMITNLPPGITEKDILDHLCDYAPLGKVALVWVLPGGPGYKHSTAAARLQMFTCEQAQRVFSFINQRGLVIRGLTASVTWHPSLTRGVKAPFYVSRVLLITGPPEIVEIERLRGFISPRIFHHTQSMEYVGESIKQRCVVWSFGCLRAQCMAVRLALSKEWPMLSIRYGAYHIDVGVAAARVINIRGNR